jgi:hypothetical protein
LPFDLDIVAHCQMRWQAFFRKSDHLVVKMSLLGDGQPQKARKAGGLFGKSRLGKSCRKEAHLMWNNARQTGWGMAQVQCRISAPSGRLDDGAEQVDEVFARHELEIPPHHKRKTGPLPNQAQTGWDRHSVRQTPPIGSECSIRPMMSLARKLRLEPLQPLKLLLCQRGHPTGFQDNMCLGRRSRVEKMTGVWTGIQPGWKAGDRQARHTKRPLSRNGIRHRNIHPRPEQLGKLCRHIGTIAFGSAIGQMIGQGLGTMHPARYCAEKWRAGRVGSAPVRF